MDTSITITGTLTLTDGIIGGSTDDKVIVTNTSATAITGQSNASFINGTLRRYIASNNDQDYPLPVGDGNTSSDYHLAQINNDLTGVTYLDANFRALANHSDAQLAISEEGTDYTSICTDGVWLIEPDASPTGSTTYDIELYFGNFGCSLANNRFAALKRPENSVTGADWTCGTCGIPAGLNANGGTGRMVADGYALRKGLTSFSEHGIGTTDNVLPVEWLYFDAKWSNNDRTKATLEWATASETNNDRFEIERSMDATTWEYIGEVPCKGCDSPIQHDYTDYDKSPNNTITSYYRVKQVDKNGDFDYSNIDALDPFTGINIIILYPSPTLNKITFKVFSSVDGDVYLDFYDSAAQLVYRESATITEGVNEFNDFDVSRLSRGNYVLRVSTTNGLHKSEKEFLVVE